MQHWLFLAVAIVLDFRAEIGKRRAGFIVDRIKTADSPNGRSCAGIGATAAGSVRRVGGKINNATISPRRCHHFFAWILQPDEPGVVVDPAAFPGEFLVGDLEIICQSPR